MGLKVLLVFVVCAFLAASKAEAGRIISSNVTAILGRVLCSANANANGPLTPPALPLNPPAFPDAEVQLRCNNINQPLARATTDAAGYFIIEELLSAYTVPQLLANCQLRVNTPLTACNASQPAVGRLVSPLRILFNSSIPISRYINRRVTIILLQPSGFRLSP